MNTFRIATVDADWLERLIERAESLEQRAIEAERMACASHDDRMMTLKEVQTFLGGLDYKTLKKMLADQQVMAWGAKIVLFRRSAIEAMCRRNSIPYATLIASKSQRIDRRIKN